MRTLRQHSTNLIALVLLFALSSPLLAVNPNSVERVHTKQIQLQNFSAEAIYGGILLKWKTLSERANNYFIIERSVDGSAFEPLTEIDGAGNADYSINYSFQDNDLVAINKGAVYYRLKQVDFDGIENTSDEAQIKLNTGLSDFDVHSDFKIEVGTNSSKIDIELSGLPEYEMVFVQFIDINGEVAAESALLTDEAGTYKDGLVLPIKLNTGTYTVVGSSPAIVIHKQIEV